MDFQAIFTKTPRGVSEVKNRAARLPRNLLSVLATIDGKSTLERLLRESKLSEMKFQQAIERLLEEGFIKACAAGEVDANASQGIRPRRLLRPLAAGDLDQLDFSAIARSALEEKSEGDSGRASEIRSPRVPSTGTESEVANARAAAEAEARRVAEEALKAQAAAEAKARADEEARVRAEAHARTEIELRARVAAEAEARSKADARARLEAHMKAEAERKARTDAERRADEERQAREALEARFEAEKVARVEAERQAREEAERKAREETEARLAEELRNREEAERRTREELERKAKEQLEARLAEERQAREAAEWRAREEAEQKAREEMEARLSEERRVREDLVAQLATEQKAKADAEQRAREAIENSAHEEAERRTREEAEHLAHEESERLAREAFESRLAAERRAREEAERRAEEEHALRQREEAQRRTQEAAERQAREEAQRRAAEETEQRAREDAGHRVREEAERRMREELEKNLAAERKAREEAERRAAEEADARARQEREEAERRRAREETEREAREQAEREGREEAARREMEAVEQRTREDAARAAAEETESAAASTQNDAPERLVDESTESEAPAQSSEQPVPEQSADSESRDSVGPEEWADPDCVEHVETENAAAANADHDSDLKPVIASEPPVASDAIADTGATAEDSFAPTPGADAASAQADVPPFFEIDLDALDARERELRAEEEEKLKLAAERHAQEMEAKDEAEREALADAERLAHEAEETSRRATEAAELATREEERRRLEEEERAAREEERRRLAEEEHRRREAEEQRIAEEERRRERIQAEQRMRTEAEQREREEAAARAEEEAQRRADEKLRKKREKEEAKERKRAAAEEKAHAREAAKAKATLSPAVPKRRVKWQKPAAAAVTLILAAAIALVHLLPWDGLAPSMEKMAASALGEPVKIGSVRAAVFPSPHFKLEDVVIGQERDVKIATVRAVPELSSLLAERKVLSRLELDSVTADANLLPRLPGWVASGNAKSLQVAKVVLRNVKLEGGAIPLPPFGGEVSLDTAGGFAKAALRSEDGKLKVDLRNKADGVEAEFSGRGWKSPLGPASIEFDEIAGKGWLRGKELALSELTARIYGGTASGHAKLVWNSPWTLTGDFSANRVDLATALKAFTGHFRATGQLSANGRYTAQSESLGRLFAEPLVEAGFKVERGEIENLDLTRALQEAAAGTPVRGGKTQFAELSGTVKVSARSYQYRQLSLSSGILLASGTTDMVPSGDLAGRLNVALAAKPNPIRANIAVSGKLSDPQLKATR